MFKEFEDQIWTTSGIEATVDDNTDESLDGVSKKIVFSESGAWALSTFTALDLAEYEEVTLQIYVKSTLSRGEIFKIEINGNEYAFTRSKTGWNHILIDCQNWEDEVSTIKFTSLIGATVLFVDLIGCRKVTYDSMDFDAVDAVKNKIQLNYDVNTTLTSDATASSTSISFVPNDYIKELTVLRLTDGVTTEDVQLASESGTLTAALINSYDKDTTVVTAFCPIVSEEDEITEADPICRVIVSGNDSDSEDVIVPMKGVSFQGGKLKRHLGALKLAIRIDCSSKKKLMSLSRQFENNCGDSFHVLLDGERVELRKTLEPVSTFEPEEDILPNRSYFYSIDPQPLTVSTKREIETINIDIDSEAV
ncbi:hypothetical protein [Leptospira sp. 'Mane']|uniref:hypothetical protein n=1 Tax=Leptospira sp. 'Mane' TaxID=3387407 RepID=UPI00398B32B1